MDRLLVFRGFPQDPRFEAGRRDWNLQDSEQEIVRQYFRQDPHISVEQSLRNGMVAKPSLQDGQHIANMVILGKMSLEIRRGPQTNRTDNKARTWKLDCDSPTRRHLNTRQDKRTLLTATQLPR